MRSTINKQEYLKRKQIIWVKNGKILLRKDEGNKIILVDTLKN